MRFTFLFFLLNIFLFSSCKQQKQELTKIEGKRIEINNGIAPKADIESFIKPYRDHIQKDLDSVLAYSVDTYSKSNGHLNTAVGNFMADVVYTQSNPVFKKRTGEDIDMVLLNHGGIRSIIPKGNITARTAYELMPFDNSIVVVKLKGSQLDSLLLYLSKAKRPHPISKLKLEIDKNNDISSATIKNKTIIGSKTYYVATNDYLYNGGDNMTFFKRNDSLYELNYKIRHALIDYFKKTDTINPVIDDRFTQKP